MDYFPLFLIQILVTEFGNNDWKQKNTTEKWEAVNEETRNIARKLACMQPRWCAISRKTFGGGAGTRANNFWIPHNFLSFLFTFALFPLYYILTPRKRRLFENQWPSCRLISSRTGGCQRFPRNHSSEPARSLAETFFSLLKRLDHDMIV